jgi:hypothetical protein
MAEPSARINSFCPGAGNADSAWESHSLELPRLLHSTSNHHLNRKG